MSNFIYWDSKHYELKEVSGSEDACMKALRKEMKLYPNMQYGTNLCDKKIDSNGKCKITIKRFKTKELCKKHCQFPSHYTRNNKVL